MVEFHTASMKTLVEGIFVHCGTANDWQLEIYLEQILHPISPKIWNFVNNMIMLIKFSHTV